MQCLPVLAVRFQGLDWASEEGKSRRGFENRNTANRIRRQRKEQRKMAAVHLQQQQQQEQQQKLDAFLRFVVSIDDVDADAKSPLVLEIGASFFSDAEEQEFFPVDREKKQQLEMLLERNSCKNDATLFYSAMSWMHRSIQRGLYTPPDLTDIIGIGILNLEDQDDSGGQPGSPSNSNRSDESRVSSLADNSSAGSPSRYQVLAEDPPDTATVESSLQYSKSSEGTSSSVVSDCVVDRTKFGYFVNMVAMLKDETQKHYLTIFDSEWNTTGNRTKIEMVRAFISKIEDMRIAESHEKKAVLEWFTGTYTEVDKQASILRLALKDCSPAGVTNSSVVSSQLGGSVETDATNQTNS